MIRGSHVVIAGTVFMTVGVATTYAISVAAGHVRPLWCYISYTGNYAIESCFFSVVLCLSANIYVFILFLRYVQLSDCLSNADLPEAKSKRMNKCNLISLQVGCLGVLGLSIAGSFQQRIFHLVHLVGVFMCIYFTLFYLIFQTYFTFALASSATAVKVFRLIVVVLCSCILVTALFFVIYYFFKQRQKFDLISSPGQESDESREDLGPNIKVGTIFEWILFLSYQLYIFSFFSDFKNIAVQKDKIVFL